MTDMHVAANNERLAYTLLMLLDRIAYQAETIEEARAVAHQRLQALTDNGYEVVFEGEGSARLH